MFDTRARIVCLTLAGPLWFGTPIATAQEGPRGGPSDCPNTTEVAARVDQLLAGGRGAGSTADKIVIRDDGASWEIAAAGHSASYADPARDCAERVRVATVFAALALEPPAPAPPAEAVAVADTPRAQAASVHHRLELAPELVLGLRRNDTATTWGGGVRWQASGRRLGLTAGVSAMLPAVVAAGPYEAKLARLAVDVSPRAWLRAGAVAFALEVGPFAGLLFAKGRNLSPDDSTTGFDVGVRLAVRVEVVWRRVSPFLAAQGELGARRFQMLVEPSGELGTAPRVWLGLLLGAAFGL